MKIATNTINKNLKLCISLLCFGVVYAADSSTIEAQSEGGRQNKTQAYNSDIPRGNSDLVNAYNSIRLPGKVVWEARATYGMSEAAVTYRRI